MTSALRLSEAVARPCMLPKRLIEARAQVFNPKTCLDLGIASRRALFGILSFFNLKAPQKAIFPSRERLRADALIGSDASLYRALHDLEGKGYISREQLRHRHNGKFYLSPIALTEKCLYLLGLLEGEGVIHNPPPRKVRDGQYKEHTKDLQSQEKTIREEVSGPKVEIDRTTKLPTPLLPLLKVGLSKSAVCWLMTQAKASGKRLEDVMHACLHRLQTIRTSREKVAYIRSLLGKSQDFAWQAKAKLEADATQSQQTELADKLQAIGSRHDGLRLEVAGQIIGVFDQETRTIRSDRGSLPLNAGLMKKLQEKGFRWLSREAS